MVDEVITKQELIDAQKDAQSLDDFINGDDEQIVVTRLLKEYPTLANAIRQIYEKGGKFYSTLAAANADIANIRTDVYVITGDNGAYYKATAGATSLTKSPYDPVEQAKSYTDTAKSEAIVAASTDATTKANTAEANAKDYTDTSKADTLSKVENSFNTKDLMTASPLPNGSKAFVDNDVEAKNGFYLKTDGTWVKTQYDPLVQSKAYTDEVSTRLNAIAESKNITTHAYVLTDPDDKVLATLSSDAVFKANDFEIAEGTLSTALKGSAKALEAGIAYGITDNQGTLLFGVDSKANVISPHPPVSGFGIDAVRSQLLDNSSINNAGAYLERVSSQHLEPMNFDVDVALDGTDGKAHVRIGSMHQISDTLFYVAFMQYAVANQDTYGELVARFVTVNWETQTATVGETIPLGENLGASEVDGYAGSASPHFFAIKDAVLLVAGVYTTVSRGMKVYKSVDNCQTWTKVGDVVTPELTYPALDSVAMVPDGLYKDRLLFAGYSLNNATKRLIGVYSDDYGATWQTGYNISPTEIGMPMEANETAVTTDSNNDFIFVIRHELAVGAGGVRKMYFAKSTDGGKTIKEFVPDSPTFGDTCSYGIQQRAPHSWDGVPSIAITHPSHGSRRGLRLYLSHNNCASWTKEYQLIPSTVITGYTSIKNIDQHTLGIVYEYGGFNAHSNVAIKFINNAEIYK